MDPQGTAEKRQVDRGGAFCFPWQCPLTIAMNVNEQDDRTELSNEPKMTVKAFIVRDGTKLFVRTPRWIDFREFLGLKRWQLVMGYSTKKEAKDALPAWRSRLENWS